MYDFGIGVAPDSKIPRKLDFLKREREKEKKNLLNCDCFLSILLNYCLTLFFFPFKSYEHES